MAEEAGDPVPDREEWEGPERLGTAAPPEGEGPVPTPTLPVPACPACGAVERRFALETPTHLHRSDERFRFSACDRCGLVYLDPRPSAEGLEAFYAEDYLPHRGPSAWGRWSPLVAAGERSLDRRRVRRVRRSVRLDASSTVLDVGCGRPSFLAALRAETGCEAWGLDFSASGWADADWSGLHLLEGGLDEVASDLPPAFDLVTMWHYLEHDFEPRRTLERLLEHATPATRLLIEVPDHDSWTRRRHGSLWAGYHTPRHAALYDAASLSELLERSG